MARNSRLRAIGGPNGSGKTTLLEHLSELAAKEHFPLGFVQNPDAIQRESVTSKRLFLGTWSVRTSDDEFVAFVRQHPLNARIASPLPRVEVDALVFEDVQNLGYLIPVLCDFFRQRWIESGESFTFETVMSGSDKLDVLKLARQRRYRTYLYYVCTEDVAINEARIFNRVQQGGHPVPAEKVSKRYERSLEQLVAAIRIVNRAYIFDNSRKSPRLIAAFENGRVRELYENPTPRWFATAVLKKMRPRQRRARSRGARV